MNKEPKLDTWALVELMGHQKTVGKLTEATIAGGAFLRVDVPGCPPHSALTQFYSPSAVYRITPIEESLARQLMQTIRQEPVSKWDLPQIADKVKDLAEDEGNGEYFQ